MFLRGVFVGFEEGSRVFVLAVDLFFSNGAITDVRVAVSEME